MLHARRVEVGHRVARVVVVGSPFDEGEVEPGEARLFEHRKVSVLRGELVALDHRRFADRMRRGGRELLDQGRVARRGLKQNRRPALPVASQLSTMPPSAP